VSSLTLAVRNRMGRTVAVGLLCLVAGTIGLWSGPLASASGALHSGALHSGALHSGALSRAHVTGARGTP
jgi:hypothetical protein